MRAVYSSLRCSPLWGLVDLCYREPTSLFYSGHEIKSSQGVRQGDVLGPLLFALAIHQHLTEAAAAHPGVTVRAYLDDISFAGSPLACMAFFKDIRARLASIGLRVNTSKCFIVGRDPSLTAAFVREGFRESKVAMVSRPDEHMADIVKILGAAVAATDDEESAWVFEYARSLLPFFKVLGTDDLRHAYSLRLLRLCIVSKWTHIIRTHAPDASAHGSEFFDEQVLACLSRITGLPIEALPEELSYPADFGGQGIVSMSDLRHLAYQASVDAVNRVPDAKSQATRSAEYFTGQVARFEASLVAPAQQVARRECVEMSPSSPLRFLSSHIKAQLSDFALQCAIFALHSVPFPSHTAISCDGCKGELLQDEVFDHAMSCKFISKFTRTHRHEKIINALRATSSQFCITTSLCTGVGYVSPNSPKKPDLVFHAGATDYVTDVSVVNLTSASYVDRNVRDFGSSLTERANRKKAKYADAALENGHTLIPFIISSRGVFHVEAVRLLKKLSAFAVWNGALPNRQTSVASFFVSVASAAVCVALFEGNAHIMREGMRFKGFRVPPRSSSPSQEGRSSAAGSLDFI